MGRRAFLQLVATTALPILSGCNALNEPPPADPTDPSPEYTSTPTTSPTDTPTRTSPTPSPVPEQHYSFGERYQTEHWGITVSSLTLTTPFQLDESEETHHMPEDEQLGIATIELQNRSDSERSWIDTTAESFAFVLGDSEIRQTDTVFDHPDFQDSVHIENLPQVEHARQAFPEGLLVESGETRNLWTAAVLSRSVDSSSLMVG